MPNFDNLKLATEGISGSRSTIILNDLGLPNFMRALPMMTMGELIPGCDSNSPFPCYIINGETVPVLYMARYQCIVKGGRAYSLPGVDPTASINFDNALKACRANGEGWTLTPGSLWQRVALECLKNGFRPNGNNNYSYSHEAPHEKGIATYWDSEGKPYRTATGSGPASWYHNNDTSGIADMNGNVWEWTADSRLLGGEINVIPDGRVFLSECDLSRDSLEWRAMLQDGKLVDPGTAKTLKYNGSVPGNDTPESIAVPGGKPVLDIKVDNRSYTGDGDPNKNYGYYYSTMETVQAAEGVNVPNMLKAYGLFPCADDLDKDGFWVRNNEGDERLPLRGGCMTDRIVTGVFGAIVDRPRSHFSSAVGFRSAFVNR